jgi:hypothetical protein
MRLLANVTDVICGFEYLRYVHLLSVTISENTRSRKSLVSNYGYNILGLAANLTNQHRQIVYWFPIGLLSLEAKRHRSLDGNFFR